MASRREAIDGLLEELTDARAWPEQFREMLAEGSDILEQVGEADEKIRALEERARRLVRELGNDLGCGHPQTTRVFRAMADMLIDWYAFRDGLEY
ncbi:MAG: hypothetical protein JRJ12_04710 [Deltaproteobacteria bacterium]|nr:hypothetical protein [Deltaproteobacteria bacterium]MBW2070441.1 hypothetical protein [Deltaproteobacteria bacterium]